MYKRQAEAREAYPTSGALVFNMAGTGSGKTRMNVRAACVLSRSDAPQMCIRDRTEGALTVNGANEAGAQVVSLAFHRDAIAFATRPLMDSANGLGNLTQSAVDPVSGLSLRLEVSREHKRTRFSYDILYGADVVRRELGCRIAG